jgi:hypothetical protein
VTAPELVLTYDRDCWRAAGMGLDVTHAELRGIEQQLTQLLVERGGPSRVELRFDTSALPAWLRQYHAHYCNYALRIVPAEGR